MTIAPEKLREIIFQLLYVQDFAADLAEEIVPLLMREHAVTKKTLYTAQEKLQAILPKLPEIDALIAGASQEYAFDRIPRIERNILRLGLFELLFCADIPPKVALSEGVRLARKFATAEAASFVNAILDVVWKQCESKKEEALKT